MSEKELKTIKVKPRIETPYEDLVRRKQQRLDSFLKNHRIDEYTE